MPVCVRITVIASAIVVLAWLKEDEMQNQIGDLACLATCHYDTPAMVCNSAIVSLLS